MEQQMIKRIEQIEKNLLAKLSQLEELLASLEQEKELAEERRYCLDWD